MAALVDPVEYPDAATLFRGDPLEGTADAPAAEEEYPDFEYGLTVILDGITAAVEG